MRISTKNLASLVLLTSVAVSVPGASRLMTRTSRHKESKFDRIMHKHDRKGELRAEVLGIDALTFRDLQHQQDNATIVRRYGFPNEHAFRLALLGKLKNELRQRGWSKQRIDSYLLARSSRMS